MRCLIFIITSVVSLQRVQSLFYNDFSNDFRHGSCRLRSVRQAEYQWNSPERSMTESFVLDDIEYKLCKYQVTWDEALVFCSSHKAHLATLDSDEKTAFIVQAIASSSSVSEEYWIGARKLYDDPWTWNFNGIKLNSENNIITDIPVLYPGFQSNKIHCLTIDRSDHDQPIFVPRACNQKRGFICQRDNNRAFDNKIRMVAATRIGEQEFRLYAGRSTWTDAVIQCRQEGLQIAEVNTVEEARVLAISMLRNRPEGIESAWIGGYTRKDDPSTWRWLASGEKITNNEMWRQNLSESLGDCLLLDRHVCQSPVYVESTCDRKRDVLCQKPPKKQQLGKTPVAVIVNGCPYWIGYYPLKWSDARRSCQSLNASLVVLDSPTTISHMMTLMLDNKPELRHIWTDGRRLKINGKWEWAGTGESIADFGKSFIPWCPDDDYYTKESGCLNLDRENLHSPLVYGLSCREKQTYVCQPLTGDCVFHSTPKLTPDVVTDASEDIQQRTTFVSPATLYKNTEALQISTVTTAYPKINLNDAIIQTTLPSENDDFGDFISVKSDDKLSEKNASSHDNYAEYFKPLTRFTLPSLPQFGIKVVSATETTTNSLEIRKKKTKGYTFLTASSSYPSTILPSLSSSSTTVKKSSNDARKAAKHQIKSPVVSLNVNNSSDFLESTISSVTIEKASEKKSSKIVNSTRPAFTQISPSLKSFSKNSSRSRTLKISTTASSILSEDLSSHFSSNDFIKTKKYSIKTTRDLNSSNVTKIASTTTTKAPDLTILKNETIIKSDLKEFQQNSRVNSFPKKLTRQNSTLMTRRKNFRLTTEATIPYDAIDDDYYNDEKDNGNSKKEENSKDEDSNEYSEDYDTASNGRSQTKKKVKKTSTASIRKNARPEKDEKDDEEDEEEGEEEEEEDDEEEEEEEEEETSTNPIAVELSKNLENALVDMMKQGLEKKEKEKAVAKLKSTLENDNNLRKTDNVPWLKGETDTVGSKLKISEIENLLLRPYYAFEGPMIAEFPDNKKLDGGAERTGEKVREFKFIGKKMSDESYQDIEKIEGRRLSNNETRRQIKRKNGNRTSNVPVSMSGMPQIQPNDPNSLMQLGRYFKNKFGGIAENSQRRFQTSGRSFMQERWKGFSANGEEELRRKGERWEETKRPGIRESEGNYYENHRRLYPRENYDIYGSLAQRELRKNVETMKEERERLNDAWPEKNITNIANFHESTQPVSPRSYSIPIRTTRSFHEDQVEKIKEKEKSFPDFKLSKLVKEVKIDLDQRMLRRYLEGFARKIMKKNSADNNDDWKNTWRQLLRQMLSVIDRMNINVNGDFMKLRVGSDDRRNKLRVSPEKLRESKWKSKLRKQRKDFVNLKNSQINNETLVNPRVENHKLLQVSVNDIHKKNSAKINSQIKDYNNSNSITESSLDQDKKVDTILPFYQNYQKFGDKYFDNQQEITDKPAVDSRGNNRQLSNFFRPQYRNLSNTQIITRPQIFPIARLSTVFGYRPLIPQLHHRMIFQPGWGQIKNPALEKPLLNAKHLPKVALSRIHSEQKDEQFEGRKNEAKKFENFRSMNSTAKPENHQESREKFIDDKNNVKSEKERKTNKNFFYPHLQRISFADDSANSLKKSNRDKDRRDKVSETDIKINESWREVNEESARNKINSANLPGYYNVTYKEENHGKVNDEIRDENEYYQEDFKTKPIWSPAHRLTKALELSVLRKFRGNPSNPVHSKNLVTRSVKETQVIPKIMRKNSREEKIEKNLEDTKEEPSIVSLRMIMNPEKKFTRILRQSHDLRNDETNPQSIELRVQFSGKQEAIKSISDENTRNNLSMNEMKNRTKIKNKNFNSLFVNNRSIRFINDMEHRKAMLNRLRAPSRKLKRNYLTSFVTRTQNETAISDARERKLRNIAIGRKNTLSNVKGSKENPKVKHYIATSLRSFDEKNFTNKVEDKWKKRGKSFEKDLGINWAEQASALFADLKESNDDLTLYIDLTLGRVGSKPRNGGRSKG